MLPQSVMVENSANSQAILNFQSHYVCICWHDISQPLLCQTGSHSDSDQQAQHTAKMSVAATTTICPDVLVAFEPVHFGVWLWP